jgi:adenosylhomocysteine nucleosidase
MKVGIIGAMEQEVTILRELLTHCKKQLIGGSEFFTGLLGTTHVVLVLSHQGKANAAMAATILLQVFRPDYVINTGSAGGMNPACQLGDITVPDVLTYHDADSRALGFEMGQIPFMPREYYPCKKLIEAVMEAAADHPDLVMRHGLHATGDSFMAGEDQLATMRMNFPAMMSVDMEATAIAQVCTQFDVPYVIIRALSDIVGQDNHVEFHEFLPLASHNSSLLITSFIRVLERGQTSISPAQTKAIAE